ncbi:MAG: hypothetical protein P8Y70_02895 [Candidatus Lokiarchaeota archaeon]
MKKKIKYNGREFIVKPINDKIIEINGEQYQPEVTRLTDNLYRVTINDCTFNLENINSKIYLGGEVLDLEIRPYLGNIEVTHTVDSTIEQIVKAPISGKILQILIDKNSEVIKDQEIIILEAMKMRNRIFAPISGKVEEIYIKEGDNVTQDTKLIKIIKT